MGKYDRLSDYELAMLFREVCTDRCTSWDEHYAREAELDEIGAAMDARGVDLRDWASPRR